MPNTLKGFNPSDELDLKDLKIKAMNIIESINLDVQSNLNCGQNMWILKPGAKSKGEGIEIHDNLNQIIKLLKNNTD